MDSGAKEEIQHLKESARKGAFLLGALATILSIASVMLTIIAVYSDDSRSLRAITAGFAVSCGLWGLFLYVTAVGMNISNTIAITTEAILKKR